MEYLETIVGVTATLIIVLTGVIVICVVCPCCPLANVDCCCLVSQRGRRRQLEEIYMTNSIYYQPCGTYHPGAPGTARRPPVQGHGGTMHKQIEMARPGHPTQSHVPIHGGTLYQQMGTVRHGHPTQPLNESLYQPIGTGSQPPVQRPMDAPPAYESLTRYSRPLPPEPKQEDATNKLKY